MVGTTVSSKNDRSNTLPCPGTKARAKMVPRCVEALAVPVRAVMFALNSTLPVDEFQLVGLATTSMSDGMSSMPEVMVVPAAGRSPPWWRRRGRCPRRRGGPGRGPDEAHRDLGTRTGAAMTSCAGVPGGAAAGSVDVAVSVIVPAGACHERIHRHGDADRGRSGRAVDGRGRDRDRHAGRARGRQGDQARREAVPRQLRRHGERVGGIQRRGGAGQFERHERRPDDDREASCRPSRRRRWSRPASLGA